jgi:hypothetical protein
MDRCDEPSVDQLKGLPQTPGDACGSVGVIARAGRVAAGLRGLAIYARTR